MANNMSSKILPRLSCNVLTSIKSDHSPLLIIVNSQMEGKVKRPYIFIFEEAWDLREDCLEIINDAWFKGPLKFMKS